MILEVTSRSLSQHDWQALDPAVVCPAMPSGRAWGARHGGYGGAACVVGATRWLWWRGVRGGCDRVAMVPMHAVQTITH